GIGKKDDLLVVGDGYALNRLLPNREAIVATPTVRRRYADQIRHRAEQNAKELAVKQSAANVLQGKVLKFARKATKTGKLYAALTEKCIVDELKKEHSIEVKEDAISISDQIKSIGTHNVEIKLADTNQKMEVEVVLEK
ncbi:50S ribosomal protein L9, partial [Candidatus Peregrinibacteria bacterium]|nr:50S ribosomal protein L9 [Candidatus Peregrinibacteria bacterium]